MKAINVYTIFKNERDRLFSRLVSGSFDAFGHGSHIALPTQIEGAGRISIGSDVFVGPGSWLLALGADGRLVIGDGTAMSGYCVLSAARELRVGRDVLFGRNVHVSDHRHGTAMNGVAIRQQPLEDERPVLIGDACWLGQNVVVLPGVTIGAGAIVGANSVVRDDVPPGRIAVGAPARVVRERAADGGS
jgi:acetyltransferase-like isoleucine patch superfamily enzyme